VGAIGRIRFRALQAQPCRRSLRAEGYPVPKPRLYARHEAFETQH
jgi:hypothetical protein